MSLPGRAPGETAASGRSRAIRGRVLKTERFFKLVFKTRFPARDLPSSGRSRAEEEGGSECASSRDGGKACPPSPSSPVRPRCPDEGKPAPPSRGSGPLRSAAPPLTQHTCSCGAVHSVSSFGIVFHVSQAPVCCSAALTAARARGRGRLQGPPRALCALGRAARGGRMRLLLPPPRGPAGRVCGSPRALFPPRKARAFPPTIRKTVHGRCGVATCPWHDGRCNRNP
jgi:hypothetical protein